MALNDQGSMRSNSHVPDFTLYSLSGNKGHSQLSFMRCNSPIFALKVLKLPAGVMPSEQRCETLLNDVASAFFEALSYRHCCIVNGADDSVHSSRQNNLHHSPLVFTSYTVLAQAAEAPL